MSGQMRTLCLTFALASLGLSANHPSFSGSYVLEESVSKSDLSPVTTMVVGETGGRFRMVQADRDGLTAHNVQGECRLDGVRRGVPEADDEWITCRWDANRLVILQTWNGSRRTRTIRTTLGADGRIVQDVKTTGPGGPKSAHLVWRKKGNAPEAPGVSAAAQPVMDPESAEAVLPEPYATPNADNPQQVMPAPKDPFLHCLEGFEVSQWAKGFTTPRFMLQGPGDEILLADSGSGTRTGVIYVFAHGDPTQRKPILSSLDRPYGMAFWKNYLYVAETDSIKRYPYNASTLTVGRGQEIISLAGFDEGHWTRSIVFDAAGEKLYVGIGSEQNVGTGEDLRRAAINRYNPDGTGHEIYASGLRNPIGLHWEPASKMLWAAVQERDGLGDDLVPDYFTHIEQGAFYGWPNTYIGLNQDPRMKPPSKQQSAKIAMPDQVLGGHVAVLDFTFYTGHQFPAEFQGGAFLAYHGSWNRSRRAGYVVKFIPFEGGDPSDKGYDFVAGWTDTGSETAVYGRPVAVFQTKDGSLLISDDGAGAIWKVSYIGEKPSR
jgi:glucose/arabinose dehydrogenase